MCPAVFLWSPAVFRHTGLTQCQYEYDTIALTFKIPSLDANGLSVTV